MCARLFYRHCTKPECLHVEKEASCRGREAPNLTVRFMTGFGETPREPPGSPTQAIGDPLAMMAAEVRQLMALLLHRHRTKLTCLHAAMEASCWELGARRPGRRLGNLRAQLRGDARPFNAMARPLMRARLFLGRHRTVTRSLCAQGRQTSPQGSSQDTGHRPAEETSSKSPAAGPFPRNPAVLEVRPPSHLRGTLRCWRRDRRLGRESNPLCRLVRASRDETR